MLVCACLAFLDSSLSLPLPGLLVLSCSPLPNLHGQKLIAHDPPVSPLPYPCSSPLQLNHPDLFDTYAVGIIFLQMASPTLRSTSGATALRQEIALAGYDLQRWRDSTRLRPDLRLLDMDGGLGFDLASKLVCKRGGVIKGRLSANEALRHPYLLLGVDQAATAISKITLSR